MKKFRLFHLLFAGGVALAWFTGEALGLVHAWTGYAIAALVLLRIALGLARQRGFEFARVLPRLVTPPRGQEGIRHPAIGKAITLALLLAVSTAAATGIMMDKGGTLVGQSIRANDGDEEHEGRENAALSLVPAAHAEDGEAREGDEDRHGLLGAVHKTVGNALLPLVVLHMAWLLLFRFELARFILFLPRRLLTR